MCAHLIRKSAELRNAHDGFAAPALCSEQGEWISRNGEEAVGGRPALADLWRTLDFPVSDTAVIQVTKQYPDIGRHHEAFVTVKENGAWYIRVHQSLD